MAIAMACHPCVPATPRVGPGNAPGSSSRPSRAVLGSAANVTRWQETGLSSARNNARSFLNLVQVRNRRHSTRHTRVWRVTAAASVPFTETADENETGQADTQAGSDPVVAEVSNPQNIKKSHGALQFFGVKNGLLGVSQPRVEEVMHQALPVMGGMASQNVLNLADSVMVGRLGTACVASVGIASTLNFVCQAALQGISSGVQAMSARRIGEGRPEIAAVPLNAALVACVMFGVPMAVGAYVLAPSIVPRLTSDAAVIAFAVPYLKARLIAVPAVGVNFAFRGFWNAVQQPQIYMNTLLVMHFVNVTLSLLLIFGCVVDVPLVGQIVIPKLGVLGAGVGTTVSVYVGMVMYLKMGFTKAKEMGFASAKPSGDDLKTLLSQAAPTSITNLLFATGMTCMYWIVGKLGTAETAAVNVLINLMLTLVLPCMGMGLAAGALSGRALGRGTYLGLSQIRHALFLPPLRDVNYSLKGSILHKSQVHCFTEAGDCSDQLP
jgi:putative MATE family efflux protein